MPGSIDRPQIRFTMDQYRMPLIGPASKSEICHMHRDILFIIIKDIVYFCRQIFFRQSLGIHTIPTAVRNFKPHDIFFIYRYGRQIKAFPKNKLFVSCLYIHQIRIILRGRFVYLFSQVVQIIKTERQIFNFSLRKLKIRHILIRQHNDPFLLQVILTKLRFPNLIRMQTVHRRNIWSIPFPHRQIRFHFLPGSIPDVTYRIFDFKI